MSKHGTIRRYGLIIEMTSRNLYPTFRRIQELLFDQGFEISDRTIQRDIEQIRNEFGIEIAYDHQRGGYYIDRDKSLDIEKFLRFLEIVNTAELLTESLKESKHALEYIDLSRRERCGAVSISSPFSLPFATGASSPFPTKNTSRAKSGNMRLSLIF